MKKIFFINRFFYPDHSATSQILTDLAFYLARAGREVHIITSGQVYDNPSARLPKDEVVHGVSIHRVASTRFGRAGLLGRLLDYLSFYRSAFALLWTLVGAGDILVAKTDPPLLSIPAGFVARKRRARLVNWLQDVYPEIASELGVRLLNGNLGRAIANRRDKSLKAACANVVVGERMAELLRAKGVPPDTIYCIPNWCDDTEIVEIPRGENRLRSEWQLQDKFVVGYSGNLGRAHDYQTLLAAAEQLRGHTRIVFLMIGGGHQMRDLAREVEFRSLTGAFRFQPYQPRENLSQSLSLPDVHWLSLKPRLEGLIVPSKFYGIAAAGRPTIAVGAADGEVARLVSRHGCGVVVALGDGRGMAEAILELSRNQGKLQFMGHNARVMIDCHFGRGRSLEKWEGLLQSVDRI